MSCHEKKTMPSVMFGNDNENVSAERYDLENIQAAGEIIMATLSGPDTYYEYRGEGFGLQFHIANAFARSIGARLRMEIANDTSELIRRLIDGECDAVAMALPKRPGLTIVQDEWTFRDDSPELLASASAWWNENTKSHFMALEHQRTKASRHSSRPLRSPMLSRQKGIISQWDGLFITYASVVGWDWRLLAAQCYQESAFDPHAVSWAGAQGLMQLMPSTAAKMGLSLAQVFEPEKNIAGAAKYLKILSLEFSDIPNRNERIKFILAAYNGGTGHVRDAMNLAKKNGKDSKRWSDVDRYILLLSDPTYYRDPIVKYGYLRGSETSNYVKAIMARWNSYRGSAPAHSSSTAPPPSKGKSSRVRPRKDFLNDSIFIK